MSTTIGKKFFYIKYSLKNNLTAKFALGKKPPRSEKQFILMVGHYFAVLPLAFLCRGFCLERGLCVRARSGPSQPRGNHSLQSSERGPGHAPAVDPPFLPKHAPAVDPPFIFRRFPSSGPFLFSRRTPLQWTLPNSRFSPKMLTTIPILQTF